MRKYRAFWDNGHDTGEFEFCSNHRKGSITNNMVIVNIVP